MRQNVATLPIKTRIESLMPSSSRSNELGLLKIIEKGRKFSVEKLER